MLTVRVVLLVLDTAFAELNFFDFAAISRNGKSAERYLLKYKKIWENGAAR